MNPIKYAVCDELGCDKLATVVGESVLKKCLCHLTQEDKEQLNKVSSNQASVRCSVLDGRDHEGKPAFRLPFSVPKGADLRGSLLVAVDLSSEDLDEVDFSYSNFFGCDLRRVKLNNASLRMCLFHRCLVRQSNINHSDARWMISCSPDVDKEPIPTTPKDNNIKKCFFELLEQMAWRTKQTQRQNSKLRLVPLDDCKVFFRRFGVQQPLAGTKENDNFDAENYHELSKTIEEAYKKTNEKGVKRLSQFFNSELGFAEKASDWSGATIRDSDLSYSRWDNAIAREVVFDGSDLHYASFADAKLHRSSFINVSFARERGEDTENTNADPPPPEMSSRFRNAKMNGCVLDGANLDSILFEETILSSARLPGARLANAIFFKSDLQNITGDDIDADKACFIASDLTGASLRGALFCNAKFWLEKDGIPLYINKEVEKRIFAAWNGFLANDIEAAKTKMRGAYLQASDFKGAILIKVVLSGSLLQGSDLTGANLTEAICLGSQFAACNVTDTTFLAANLTSADFSDSGSVSADSPPKFSGANLEDATLKGMDLSNAVFENLKSLEAADFSDCRLIGVKFCSTNSCKPLNIKRATFRNSRIDKAKFTNVNLHASDLSFCSGEDAEPIIFNKCDMASASLRALELKKVEWRNCDLQKTDISDTQLYEALFIQGCNLSHSRFTDATIRFLLISQAKDLSNIYFDGAKIGERNGIKCKIIGEENFQEIRSFGGLSFDKSEIVNFQFKNIGFDSSSFKYALLNKIEFINTYISFGEFLSSKIVFDLVEGSNFLYCDFIKSSIEQIEGYRFSCEPKATTAFLGCNFNDSALFQKPNGMVFADCQFSASSFLATNESTKSWSSAMMIQCIFRSQKYHGIKEMENDIKSGLPSEKIVLKDFLESCRTNLKDEDARLEAVRNRADDNAPLSQWTKRLKTLIPPKEERKGDRYTYAAMYELCREIRKDLLVCGLTETASIAYVLERNYFQKTLSFEWRQLFHVFVDLYKNLLAPFCLCFYAFFILWLSQQFSAGFAVVSPFLIIFVCFIPGLKQKILQHIYDYGESVLKMLWTAIGCVFAFSILFYSFVPNDKAPPLTEDKQNVSFLTQLSIPSRCPASGHLKIDNKILEKNDGCFDLETFLTCLYFSGVTFTTLGYGDIQPVGLVRLLAITEAGIGASLLALFVFSFTRRNAQR